MDSDCQCPSGKSIQCCKSYKKWIQKQSQAREPDLLHAKEGLATTGRNAHELNLREFPELLKLVKNVKKQCYRCGSAWNNNKIYG